MFLRLVVASVVLASVSLARASSVEGHMNPDGSVTLTFHAAAGESVRSAHCWLPAGSHTSGTTSLPVDPASGLPLPGWTSTVENGPRGSGWGWVNPGTNGSPLGPDGMSVTLTPGLLSGRSGAFPSIWSTDNDGHPCYPPRGGSSWPANHTGHGALTGPDGEPLPLPVRGVSLGFTQHDGSSVCSCAPGEPLGGLVEAFGADSGNYRVILREELAPTSRRASLPSAAGRSRFDADRRELFGLDRFSRVPDAWQVAVDGSSGSIGGGASLVTFRVGEGSTGRGRRFYAVVVADFDSDGTVDAWSVPAEIWLR